MKITHRPGTPIKGPRPGLFNWLVWAFFGNEKDGYIGDRHWNPQQKDTWLIRVRWWLRNPCHNLTWYVIGIVQYDTTRYDVRDEDGPGWNPAWSVRDDRPARRYRYWHYIGRKFEFYAGWRGTGAFGFKLRRVSGR